MDYRATQFQPEIEKVKEKVRDELLQLVATVRDGQRGEFEPEPEEVLVQPRGFRVERDGEERLDRKRDEHHQFHAATVDHPSWLPKGERV